MSANEESLKSKYAALKAKKLATASSNTNPSVPTQKIITATGNIANINLANLPQQPPPNLSSSTVKRKRKSDVLTTQSKPEAVRNSEILLTDFKQTNSNGINDHYSMEIEVSKPVPQSSTTTISNNNNSNKPSTLKIPKKIGNSEDNINPIINSSNPIISISLPPAPKPVESSYEYVEENGIRKVNKVSFAISDHLNNPKPYTKRNNPPPTEVKYSQTTVYVSGLTPNCRLEDLLQVFSAYGTVKDCKYEIGRSYAYIEFASKDSAQLAIDQMDSSYVAGSVIHVKAAKIRDKRSNITGTHSGVNTYVELESAEQEELEGGILDSETSFDLLLAQFKPDLITSKMDLDIETFKQNATTVNNNRIDREAKNVLNLLSEERRMNLAIFSKIGETTAGATSTDQFSHIPPRDHIEFDWVE